VATYAFSMVTNGKHHNSYFILGGKVGDVIYHA